MYSIQLTFCITLINVDILSSYIQINLHELFPAADYAVVLNKSMLMYEMIEPEYLQAQVE